MAACPVTVTVSVTAAIVSLIRIGSVSAIVTLTTCFCDWKPDSSKTTVYSPAGRNGMMKSPLADVTAVRAPWTDGDVAVTVTPGSARLSGSTTAPVIAPVGLPWAAADAATARAITISKTNLTLRMTSSQGADHSTEGRPSPSAPAVPCV